VNFWLSNPVKMNTIVQQRQVSRRKMVVKRKQIPRKWVWKRITNSERRIIDIKKQIGNVDEYFKKLRGILPNYLLKDVKFLITQTILRDVKFT